MQKLKFSVVRATCLILCGLYFFAVNTYSQTDCTEDSDHVYTSMHGGDIGAESVTATREGDGVYISGYKDDSTLVMKVDLSGNVIWSVGLDILPGVDEFPSCMILDAQGKLVIGGTGVSTFDGRAYIFQFDPVTRAIIWSREYPDGPTNYLYNITQKDDGNYIVNTNPRDYPGSRIVVDLFEINANSGAVVAAFAKKYSYFLTETLGEITYHDGHIYGTGRYKTGGSVADFRHVVTKLDSDNGDQVWTRFGHTPQNMQGRLYGQQILIHNDEIFTGYVGDPNGTSLDNNELFLQKTSLNGNLIWCKRYVISGLTQNCHDIIYSDDGFIVLASHQTPQKEFILFKIDSEGELIWSRKFSFPVLSSFDITAGGNNRLTEVGNHIIFTGTGTLGADKNIVLVKTDLEGKADHLCFQSEAFALNVIPVTNPAFFSGTPDETFDAPVAVPRNTTPKEILIIGEESCVTPDTLLVTINTSICEGEMYEGYAQAGTYIDTFISVGGCDSVRTLHLDILPRLETFVHAVVCEGTVVHGYDETGFYVDTFIAVTGCDSLSILDLTVYDTVMRSVSIQICNGNEYMGYSTTGIYLDTFQTYQGCDSIIELSLQVVDEIIENISETICLGDSYNGYNQSGVYQDTTASSFGCDSIIILDLTVSAEEKNVSVSICEGGHFEEYSETGFYTDTLSGIIGPCDTIRHLSLTVVQQDHSSISEVICEGDVYEGYSMPGIYTDTLLTAFGCDSVRTLSLTLLPPSFSNMTLELCGGSAFGYTKPGVYTDTLVSHNGCDSIRTLILHAEPMYIPNVMSPNNDGYNDEFRIFTPGDKPLDIAYFGIFDRFGNMVYETYAWPVVWYGKDKNELPYNPGVFAYILSYRCNHSKVTETGNLTLIR